MNIGKSLDELLKPSAIIPLKKEYEKNYCILNEADSDYQLTIKHLPDDAIVIKCDEFTSPKSFFNNNKMECKRADYAIVLIEKKMILYIELKRSKKSTTNPEIVAQLKGAKCVINYCACILTHFWGENDLDKYQDRYYKYINKNTNKRPSREAKLDENYTPEAARKISKETIFLKELIS